jgi:hypothetical protein
MQVSDEFIPDYRRIALLEYLEKLGQFIQLRDHHGGDGTHPDVVKAHQYLERAKRMRCEVDPEFAATQPQPAVAA